jgi:restriction endonuclease Mrr
MAEPRPYYLARWIADEIHDVSYISLRSSIEAILKSHIPEWSDEQIFEISERTEAEVFKELEKISENLISDGVEPSFMLDGEPQTAYIKGSNLLTVSVLTKIKQKTPKEFERFCADILTSLGGTTRTVGGTGDGGVDFIATNLPITGYDLPALRVSSLIVIGQAKRYQDNKFVTVNEVRDFLGGAIAHLDTLKRENARYGLFTPVLYAFWTTSDFTKPAYDFYHQCGLWGLGGLSLAQLAIRLNMNVDR